MKKAILVMVILLLAFYGCGEKPEEAYKPTIHKEKAIDINHDGIIKDDDVFILDDMATKVFKQKIQPLFTKAGIKGMSDYYAPDAKFKVRSQLTVIELESLNKAIDEYGRLNAQKESTAKVVADSAINKPKRVIGSGKVRSCADWGGIELSNGKILKFSGIQLGIGDPDEKYTRLATLFSVKLIVERLVRYELTGVKSGNVDEAIIYVDDICINEKLVERGYALAIRDKSDMSVKLVELETQAKENGSGLWALIKQNPSEGTLY